MSALARISHQLSIVGLGVVLILFASGMLGMSFVQR